MQPLLALILAAATLPSSGTPAANHRLAMWFGSQTCPALDGLYSKKQPPAVKTGSETLIVNVPTDALATRQISMTVPWYVYDPKAGVAYSHIGGDSGVVETLRAIEGAPPSPLPKVNLSGGHTTSGIKIGTSAQPVVRILGKPLIIRACGLERYEYSDSNVGNGEQNDLDFTIENGRVIEIVHTSWG